ncbi:MAG: ACT domain-containing protein, partial [Methanothrix sp.]|nr:ACT domain-containing protein [Methanothrix sp.]
MPDLTAHYVVSVVARDRVGIIADVSQTLYDLGANLEALSQTVVWEWFTMIICAAFPEHVKADD